jgi:hypothetical protein
VTKRKKREKVKIWYWTTKRRVFELIGGLFDGWNTLRRDDEFLRRDNGGRVVYRGCEENDADNLMRSKRRKKGTTKGGAEYPRLADKQLS